jgi:hypothetical protein
MVKLLTSFLCGAVMFSVAVSTNAALAGKNVLLIHGFNLDHIFSNPVDQGEADGLAYWDAFEPAITDSATARRLFWPSNLRIAGEGGIVDIVVSQLETVLSSGFCDEQCVILTHSTGDIVARFLLANKLSLLGPELAERFKVAAVIDMAGAGGGTELADVAVDLVNGLNTGGDVIEAFLNLFGIELELGTDLGVLVDLQPNVARNTAVNNFPSIPHLRIVGAGDEDFGLFTHPLIKGGDDSVVPLHSACGGAFTRRYDSCVKDLRMDGRVTRVAKAPSASELYDFHFPIILSEDFAHNDMQNNGTGRDMTFASSSAELYEQSAANSIAVNVESETVRVWWELFKKYRFITGAKDKTMGQVIAESFDP